MANITMLTMPRVATKEHIGSKTHQFSSLDGLRGLAILLVLWCHTDSFLSSYVRTWPLEHVLGGAAYSGVILFFVLSGFLLFLPYARTIIVGGSWPAISQFYLRRALRILPSYYLLIPIFLFFLSSSPYGVGLRLLGPLQALLGLTLLYDLQSNAYNLVSTFDGPLWSLTIEWQFYFVLPLIALALAWLARRFCASTRQYDTWPWTLVAGLALLAVIGIAVRAFAASAHYVWGYPDPVTTSSLPWLGTLLTMFYGVNGKYLEVFAFGMLASVFYVAGVERDLLAKRVRAPLGWALCGVGLLGIAACIPWAQQADRLFGWGQWINNFPPASAWLWSVFGDDTFGLCYMCLLLGTLLVPAATHAFSWRPLRFFGKISYSLYLWHVIGLTLFFGVTRGAFDVASVALLLIVIVLWSTTLYALIERPFLRLQSRFRPG